MKIWVRWSIVLGLGLAACGSLPPAAPTGTPASAGSSNLVPVTSSAASSPTPSPTLAPSSTATAAPTYTPTPLPSPTSSLADSLVVYRPDKNGPDVAAVAWNEDGTQLTYALSPLGDQYLLQWHSFDASTQDSRPLASPAAGSVSLWAQLGLGYPTRSAPYSELMGYVSLTGKYLIFPNAGFPSVFTNPNYIYVIETESQLRIPVLGPTFRGTVDKVDWISHDTQAIFDYRYERGREIFITNLRSGITTTLADLPGPAGEQAKDWQLSPNESAILIPAAGVSQIISLAGKPLYTLDTPGGMLAPAWSQTSQSVYFWSGADSRLVYYSLGSQAILPVLELQDLVASAPVAPTVGMPFAISPDLKKIAFWSQNWIWVVTLR